MITPEFFRLAQILNPLSGQQDNQEEEFHLPDYNPMTRMNQLYTPEHDASDRLTQLIDRFPQRREPGMLRKIVASVAGMSGDPNRVEEAMYAPHRRELSDWEAQLNPAVQAANFERSSNINSRGFANQIVSQELRDRNLDRQVHDSSIREKQGQDRINQGNARVNQANERIKIAKLEAKGGQLKTDDAGKSFIVYKDGSTEPVDLSMLSFEEQQNIKNKYAMKRIEKVNEGRVGARDRVKTLEIDNPDKPGTKMVVSINLDTQVATPVTLKKGGSEIATPDKTTETQKAKGRLERARKVKLSNPRIAPYITIKGSDFDIKPPNKWLPGGITKAEYDKAYNDIYQGETATVNNSPPPVDNNQMTMVINPQGKRVNIKSADLQRALSSGYKQAQ